MKIKSLVLSQFRNYESLDMSFNQGTNLLYGENAQGKTNVLEAVYLCGTTKSHRTAKDRDMIRQGQEESHIRMKMEVPKGLVTVDMHLSNHKKKAIAIDSVPIRKAGELVSLGNFVFFSPEDLAMIKNGPAQRRRFMDMELCQTDPLYIHQLACYNHVLAQRGKLLKDMAQSRDFDDLIEVWDEQLVRYGQEVMRARETFVKEIGMIAGGIHHALSGGKETLAVVYDRKTDPESFADALKVSREKDLRYKLTHVGPHRDDLLITVNGMDLRSFGSQGQQRTAALSLKMAEIELLKKIKEDTPVLLLDDVLSELDRKRQRFLLEQIRNIQTLITGTGLEIFRENDFPVDQVFYVEKGVIRG